MGIRALIVCLVIAGSATVGGEQGSVTRYDLAAAPELEVGANLRIRKVMGQIGTFMIGTFKAGWKNTPHHHTHEQINVGLTGSFNIVTPTPPHVVSPLRGLLIPPDVLHGNDVSAETVSPLLIEFQPVRRVDFPPERQRVTFPQAPAPVPAPATMDLDFRKDAPGWQRVADGVRRNSKIGQGAAVSAWEIAGATKTSIEMSPRVPGAELFFYVMDGNLELTVAGDRHVATAGVLLVVAPGAPPPQVRASSASSVLVLEAAKAQ